MKTKLLYVAIDGTEFEKHEECKEYENKYLQNHAEIKLDKDLNITTDNDKTFCLSISNKIYVYDSKTKHYHDLYDEMNSIQIGINTLKKIIKEKEEKLGDLFKDKYKLAKVVGAFDYYLSNDYYLSKQNK